jgi:hypothetical protein
VSLPASSERINRLEERQSVEVGVPGHDTPNAMLAHQERGVGIVHKVAREVRHFLEDAGATAAWRSVGIRTSRPGDASSATTVSSMLSVVFHMANHTTRVG